MIIRQGGVYLCGLGYKRPMWSEITTINLAYQNRICYLIRTLEKGV